METTAGAASASQADLPTSARAHRSIALSMDTVVSIEVVTTEAEERARAAMARALVWFAAVEQACSRFDASSGSQSAVGQKGAARLVFVDTEKDVQRLALDFKNVMLNG